MASTEPTASSPSSPGVVNRLLQSLSISKSDSPQLPPIQVGVPEDPAATTPNDPVLLPTADRPSNAIAQPETKAPSGALGRLKSLTKFKKDKKADAPPAVNDPEGGQLSVVTEATPTSHADRPTPLTLAQQIRALTEALPPITSKVPLPKPKPVKKGPNGKPIPPPDASAIHDAKLIEQLSTPSIMNGSREQGSASVWSLLEALGAPKHQIERDEGGGVGDGGDGDDDDDSSSKFSSVMMYAPLIPTSDSTVELADSELRPATHILVREENVMVVTDEEDEEGGKTDDVALFSFPWPWKKKTPACAPPPKPVKVWVPSTTKLSIHVTWWGFRLYLPPPVLVHLSATEIEVAKRAAMITTALQWIISHLPIAIFPLELQPAVLILQRIAPYLTYIGSFIAWSWATIDGFDKGYGVILSATWLLPIALIPSSWPAPTVPKAVTPAAPASSTSPSSPTNPTPPAPPTSPTSPSTSTAATVSSALPTSPTSPTFFVNMFKSKAK